FVSPMKRSSSSANLRGVVKVLQSRAGIEQDHFILTSHDSGFQKAPQGSCAGAPLGAGQDAFQARQQTGTLGHLLLADGHRRSSGAADSTQDEAVPQRAGDPQSPGPRLWILPKRRRLLAALEGP